MLAQSAPPERKPEAISQLGRPLFAQPAEGDSATLERNLEQAQQQLRENPDLPDRIVWVGRRLGYLWRMNEAIEVFADGIRLFPEYAPFYRHRGHRYISLRRFDEAIADFEKAVRLIEGKTDEVEADGAPNARNIPLTTLGFNIWYHLGVAKYLKGDFVGALAAFQETAEFTRGFDDNLVAVTDWTYLVLRRLGREREAMRALDPIKPGMEMIENQAYYRRCLMYKGLLRPDELLDVEKAGELDLVTLGYGLGAWHLLNGERDKAVDVFRRVTSGPYWPAFGHIAAEVELVRLLGENDDR